MATGWASASASRFMEIRQGSRVIPWGSTESARGFSVILQGAEWDSYDLWWESVALNHSYLTLLASHLIDPCILRHSGILGAAEKQCWILYQKKSPSLLLLSWLFYHCCAEGTKEGGRTWRRRRTPSPPSCRTWWSRARTPPPQNRRSPEHRHRRQQLLIKYLQNEEFLIVSTTLPML